jgi:hypothetical protein
MQTMAYVNYLDSNQTNLPYFLSSSQ